MSDTFDHEWDAWDSLDNDDSPWSSHSYSVTPFIADSLHYHDYYDNLRLVHATELAYLFSDLKGKFWVPKALCRELDSTSCYIHNSFTPHYIGF